MVKDITIGIIGGGMMAQTCHIPFYVDAPGCTVEAVAESRPSLVSYLEKDKGLRVVSGYQALLGNSKVEAVIISAPRAATGPLTLQALKAGKHVLTEKPMAHTVEQAHTLVNQAAKNNLIYAVGFMKRYDPGIIAAKKKLETIRASGELGALLFARFYDHAKSNVFAPPPHQRPAESRDIRFDTWTLYPEWMPESARDDYSWFVNVASHDVNLMHYFLGAGMQVMATVQGPQAGIVAVMRHGETPVNLEVSKTEAGKWLQGAEFFFEKGMLKIEIPSPMDTTGVSRVMLLENNGSPREITLQSDADQNPSWSFALQAQGFLKALRGEALPATSGAEGLADMKLIEEIWRKAVGI